MLPSHVYTKAFGALYTRVILKTHKVPKMW